MPFHSVVCRARQASAPCLPIGKSFTSFFCRRRKKQESKSLIFFSGEGVFWLGDRRPERSQLLSVQEARLNEPPIQAALPSLFRVSHLNKESGCSPAAPARAAGTNHGFVEDTKHLAGCALSHARVAGCHVMFHHGSVVSCHVMSCHVMSCHVMSCHVRSCHVMSCHVMSCHVVSCPVMS